MQRANVVSLLAWCVMTLAGFVVFRALGFPSGVATTLLLGIALGGKYDVPLIPGSGTAAQQSRAPRLGLNVGGGLIPLGVATQQTLRMPSSLAGTLALSIAAVAAFSYGLARPVAGRGIVLPWALPALLGAALALILAPSRAPSVAFAAGTFGTCIGADLLHLHSLRRIGAIRLGIGGDGPFDGLLWSGLLAAGMAGGF
jgi:uncharacterized membrane protein